VSRPFLDDRTLRELVNQYGSPLYVYSERILRDRCREMKALVPGRQLSVNYSAKANSNLELLRVIRSEGVDVDAMSPGEIHLELLAGFPASRIFYVGNNVGDDEMLFAIERGVLVSVDSLAQLDRYGRLNPGSEVAVRFNPGVGVGHHEKVVTAGKATKFGVPGDAVDAVKALLLRHRLRLRGINQHIGSLFLKEEKYLEGVEALLSIAARLPPVDFIDMGGGFGIPYREHEERLDLASLGSKLGGVLETFLRGYSNREVTFKIEPGRYLVAECGLLLGTVHALKESYGVTYVGTDLGFNVLARPVLYDSYHEVHVAASANRGGERGKVTVVGNICESGDIIAKDRELPRMAESDVIAVCDAGAYGFAMASSYNGRLLPAEVLVAYDGSHRLVRRRQTLDDLVAAFPL
jgi:diaminopimelate decarboxylase